LVRHCMCASIACSRSIGCSQSACPQLVCRDRHVSGVCLLP
jgi:hypothetical protein